MFTNIPPTDKTASCTYTSIIHKKHPHKGDTQGIDASHIGAVLLTKFHWYKQPHTVHQYNNNPRLSTNGTAISVVTVKLIYFTVKKNCELITFSPVLPSCRNNSIIPCNKSRDWLPHVATRD